MLYNEENKAILLDRIEFLQNAIDSIFHLGDETITDSIIRNMYDLCTKGSLPIDIVDKVVVIPEYLSKDRKRDLYGLTIGLAYSNEKIKRYNEAIAAFDKALEIDPCHVITLCNKGVILDAVGKHDEAIRCNDKALEIDPLCALAWHNKGFFNFKNVRYDEAIRCYDKALEIDPKDVDALVLVHKGYSLRNLGKYGFENIHGYVDIKDIVKRALDAEDNYNLQLCCTIHLFLRTLSIRLHLHSNKHVIQ